MAIGQVNTKTIVIPSPPVAQLVRAFNIAALQPLVARDNPYNGRNITSSIADPELYKSTLGTPVVIDLTIGSVTYTDFNTNRIVTTDEVRLETVLCTVVRPSVIVKTQINNRNGTVKEYISKGDFEVTINGIITGENGVMPAFDVLRLSQALEAPVAVPVSSRYLNNLGVFNIVVDTYTMPQVAGGISKQDFTINAVSDEPLELQIQ